jgi:hypothetical protein
VQLPHSCCAPSHRLLASRLQSCTRRPNHHGCILKQPRLHAHSMQRSGCFERQYTRLVWSPALVGYATTVASWLPATHMCPVLPALHRDNLGHACRMHSVRVCISCMHSLVCMATPVHNIIIMCFRRHIPLACTAVQHKSQECKSSSDNSNTAAQSFPQAYTLHTSHNLNVGRTQTIETEP